MKKNILIAIVLSSVFFVTACNSAKVQENNENTTNKKEKNYIGWVYSTGKDIIHKDGAIQLKIKQNLGSFCLAAINNDEKVLPLLSTIEEFTTTSFYLKTSNKVYTLRNDGNIQTSANNNNTGVSIDYSLDQKFDVLVTFSILKSDDNNQPDMLKVTYKVTNLSKKRDEFAIKAIFDTILGESDQYHFYSSEDLPIKNEVSYRTMQNQKWFVSKNKSAAMQFLLNGADITAPEFVALANYSTFQKNSWEPEMLTYRAFDNVLSYNNSAVGIIWPSVKLNPKSSYKNVFYIAVATDGKMPNGHNYIFKSEAEEDLNSNVDISADLQKENKVPKSVISESKNVENVVNSVKPVNTSVTQVADESSENSSTKYTSEYIQSLIDRITELEKDTSAINDEEINQLNAELDKILSTLR